MSSRRIVVDASVLAPTGPPEGPRCWRFLRTFRKKTSHRIVFSRELREECRRHETLFSKQWLTSMYAARRVDDHDATTDEDLRLAIRRVPGKEAERQAMLKDAHLLEAALATDRAIASRDERLRGLLRAKISHLRAVRPVVWVNPGREEEDAVAWLIQGAKAEAQRRLGGG